MTGLRATFHKSVEYIAERGLAPILVWPFLSKASAIKKIVFAATRRCDRVLLHARGGREEYIVDSRDRVISRGLFVQGEYDFHKFEKALTLLEPYYKKGHAFTLVDIGANVGSICIPAVARGFASRAIAVEPHPGNCRLLRVNVAMNDLTDRIHVSEFALSDGDVTELSLELSSDNFGDHRVRSSSLPGRMGETRRSLVEVKACRLDDIATPAANERGLVWMDVQGYEGHVLQGCKTWIDAGVPICMEFWPYGMRRASSYERVRNALSGYRGFFNLSDPHSILPIAEIDELYSSSDQPDFFTDLLVVC